MSLASRGFLSDNCSKQVQFNTVFLTQEEMDRVGFEPTTIASFFQDSSFCLLSNSDKGDIIILISLIFQNNHLETL
jgi:hypothetical protein